MARYGYFCGDYFWLVRPPTKSRSANSARIGPGDFDPSLMGEVVFHAQTKQGISVEYSSDGLAVFDFREYLPLSEEEKNPERTQLSGAFSLAIFTLKKQS